MYKTYVNNKKISLWQLLNHICTLIFKQTGANEATHTYTPPNKSGNVYDMLAQLDDSTLYTLMAKGI